LPPSKSSTTPSRLRPFQRDADHPLARPGIRIAPSLLAADFARLSEEIATVERNGADLLHLDVMDGHFVPNISIGPPVIEWIRPITKLFLDAHLMIEEPMRYAEAFAAAGCDHITFHPAVVRDAAAVIRHIHDLGASAGVSLNPDVPAETIWPILDDVQMVLIMSVWPGFGGQSFIPDVLAKTAAIRRRLRPDQRLEIDGGIGAETIARAAAAGADTFVAGTAIFRAPDPAAAIRRLRDIATKARST
jgi:ribulose-phosphate 3-epimerase